MVSGRSLREKQSLHGLVKIGMHPGIQIAICVINHISSTELRDLLRETPLLMSDILPGAPTDALLVDMVEQKHIDVFLLPAP